MQWTSQPAREMYEDMAAQCRAHAAQRLAGVPVERLRQVESEVRDELRYVMAAMVDLVRIFTTPTPVVITAEHAARIGLRVETPAGAGREDLT